MNLSNIEFNVNVFEEVDAKQAHLKSRSSLRSVPPTLIMKREKDFRQLDDHALFQIIARHDLDSLHIVAFAIVIMQKRYSSNFVVQGGKKLKKNFI